MEINPGCVNTVKEGKGHLKLCLDGYTSKSIVSGLSARVSWSFIEEYTLGRSHGSVMYVGKVLPKNKICLTTRGFIVIKWSLIVTLVGNNLSGSFS